MLLGAAAGAALRQGRVEAAILVTHAKEYVVATVGVACLARLDVDDQRPVDLSSVVDALNLAVVRDGTAGREVQGDLTPFG
jgi:hypothetical protein